MGPRIAVLGAGVVGLSTALCLQRTIPKVSVTVIADQFIEDTLSFGAGGFFRPDLNIGPTYDVTRCQVQTFHPGMYHEEEESG
uniref:Putative secreted protein n=1 Tax=Ixodes ricinus TaxID=34613 RepID=A0A6B0U8A5_IXORI